MTNETVHPGSGYQPHKTDKPKAQYPPEGSGVPITADAEVLKELTELLKNNPDNFYTVKTLTTPYPSDLELKIRKEVMDAVDNIWHEMESIIIGQPLVIIKDMTIIKDRLNLLWGEND